MFLSSLIILNTFDSVTICLALVTIVAVQIINAVYGLSTDKVIAKNNLTTTTTNGKIHKQTSEQYENTALTEENYITNEISAASTSPSSTPQSSTSSLRPTLDRHSVNLPLSSNNWHISHATTSPDNVSDEYGRDSEEITPNKSCVSAGYSSFTLTNGMTKRSIPPSHVEAIISGHRLTEVAIEKLNQTQFNEIHEDEDTLSLENLFPGDQTEIWESKIINYIIDELIQTEGNYVNNLRKGLTNYGYKLQQCDHLPNTLNGVEKQQQLLGNVEEILELHEHHIYPSMLRYQRNLKTMFDELSEYIDRNFFYCYVTFTITKKASMQLRQENRQWLQSYQTEINDKLGIDSFLVQPIQRLTKYPLLLKLLISEFFGLKCKPVLTSLCKLETRMRRLLEVVNQAEEISNIEDLTVPELSVEQLGYFRRSADFEAYNHRSRKKYQGKVLLFDNILMSVEQRKKRLICRHHYPWSDIELRMNSSKSITLLLKPINSSLSNDNKRRTSAATPITTSLKEEYDFLALDSTTHWLRWAHKIMETQREGSLQETTFSLRMDLVLGVAFAIWFIWLYL